MEKLAETDYPIHDLLQRRWSPRAFSDRMVEPERLRSLWEAARWAPSSFNEQPWNFIVATRQDQAEYTRLLSCLVENNIRWAQKAPVLMISVAKLSFEKDSEPNRHAFHDVGLAVENLVIQATAFGLVLHQMAGIYPEKVRELYRIPDQYEPVAAIALGYPGDPGTLPDGLRQRELAKRTRKPLREFVFTGRWEQVSPLLFGE
ncbi:MAG TPA: nitroreductase family protein [Nitrospiraceae bacterium]|nr:nitroreductase family protein [Nitrospiraceae bacterium]